MSAFCERADAALLAIYEEVFAPPPSE
jgi:hypothetical protein